MDNQRPFLSLEGLMENQRETIPDPKGTRYVAEQKIVYATARAGTGHISFLLLYRSGLFRCKAITVRAHRHRHQWRPVDQNGPEENQGHEQYSALAYRRGDIEKYSQHPYVVNGKGVLPVLTNQKSNAYLKEIADVCGIHKNLTTHLARHTFATTVTLSKGVSISTVSKMLGHRSLKTTQIYAKVLDSKIADEMNLLKEKLSEEAKKLAASEIKDLE